MTKGVRKWLVGGGIFKKNFCNTYINIWTFPSALPGGSFSKLPHRRKPVASQHCAVQQRAASRRPGAGRRQHARHVVGDLSVVWVMVESLTETTQGRGSGRAELAGFRSFGSFGHRFLVAGPRRGNARCSHRTAIVTLLIQYINSSIRKNR